MGRRMITGTMGTGARMLDYEFMRTAFAASAIVAVVAGLVGYLLVLRRQTFAGHALAHVGFTGATGAVLAGFLPFHGLLVATLAAGAGMGYLGEGLAERDVAIGMVLSMALGLGLLFLHFYTSFATQATALLFGNVLAIDPSTLGWLALVGAVAVLGVVVLARPLVFASLQPEVAAAKGVRVKTLGTLFLMLVALATSAAAQIVGVLLVFTLMIGPAAAAQLICRTVITGLVASALIALLAAWSGIALAYYTDWPPSFWITAVSAALYLLALVVGPAER